MPKILNSFKKLF